MPQPKSLRILIIVDCYLPAVKSSAKLVHDLGVEFKSRSHDVIVLTPSEAVRNAVEISVEDGLRIVRVKTGKIKGAAKIARAIQEVRLSQTLWRRAGPFLRENRCDLVVFYSPSIFLAGIVKRLKALWKCKTYLVLRDIFPQWAVDAGVLRKGLVYSFFRRKEIEQHVVADVIGVQTPANLKYFSHDFPGNHYALEVLYNWTSLREPDVPPGAYRERLGLKDKVVFFFGGNIGVAQDMDNILRLAQSLTDHPEIFFLLVGEGSEVARLQSTIATESIPNIRVLPSVSQNQYLSMLSEFDVGLISLDRRLKTQNVPGKLMSYLYFSKPTLASINPENDLRQIIEGADAGFCLLNGDDAGLKNKALLLAEDGELRSRFGNNARKLLESTFSASRAADTILSHLS